MINFHNPIKIISGNKALENIAVELELLQAKSPLVLISKDTQCLKILNNPRLDITTFKVLESDNLETINNLAKIFQNLNKDSIIVFGSGKIINFAKMLNICLSSKNYEKPNFSKLKPFIFIPTGSLENDDISPFCNFENLSFKSQFLIPEIIILDKRAIDKSQYSIFSSLKALANSIEALLFDKNPFVNFYAHTSIELIYNGLKEKDFFKLLNGEIINGIVLNNINNLQTQNLEKNSTVISNLLKIIESYLQKLDGDKLLLALLGTDNYSKIKKENQNQAIIENLKSLQKFI